MSKNMSKKTTAAKKKPAVVVPQKPAWKLLALVAASVVGGFMALNLLIWVAYIGRVYPGVKIGSQQLTNLDKAAVQASLANYTADYELAIKVNGESKTVMPADVGLTYDLEESAHASVDNGKAYIIPLYGLLATWRNGATQLRYTVDEAKLQEVTGALAGPGSVAPTDAKVIIEGETVRVEADKPGQGVDHKQLVALIKENISQAKREGSIAEQATEATVTTAEATAMVMPVQQALKLPITLQVNGKSFSPGATEIGKWLVIKPGEDGKLALTVNQDILKSYVASVAKQVDVAAVNKKINMTNGVVKTVNQGVDGLALDQAAVAAALSQAAVTGKDTVITGATTKTAFKTITNNTVDLNGKYIEINLSRQHLWAYQDKVLVYESAITSGATGAGFPTVQGLFSVKAKQTNRNLNGYAIGYNYNVFVNYWMPFSGNYGMHDASWRSSFGGQDYYRGGSHGCVNMPLATAAWLYNWALVGTPVWVHS